MQDLFGKLVDSESETSDKTYHEKLMSSSSHGKVVRAQPANYCKTHISSATSSGFRTAGEHSYNLNKKKAHPSSEFQDFQLKNTEMSSLYVKPIAKPIVKPCKSDNCFVIEEKVATLPRRKKRRYTIYRIKDPNEIVPPPARTDSQLLRYVKKYKASQQNSRRSSKIVEVSEFIEVPPTVKTEFPNEINKLREDHVRLKMELKDDFRELVSQMKEDMIEINERSEAQLGKLQEIVDEVNFLTPRISESIIPAVESIVNSNNYNNNNNNNNSSGDWVATGLPEAVSRIGSLSSLSDPFIESAKRMSSDLLFESFGEDKKKLKTKPIRSESSYSSVKNKEETKPTNLTMVSEIIAKFESNNRPKDDEKVGNKKKGKKSKKTFNDLDQDNSALIIFPGGSNSRNSSDANQNNAIPIFGSEVKDMPNKESIAEETLPMLVPLPTTSSSDAVELNDPSKSSKLLLDTKDSFNINRSRISSKESKKKVKDDDKNKSDQPTITSPPIMPKDSMQKTVVAKDPSKFNSFWKRIFRKKDKKENNSKNQAENKSKGKNKSKSRKSVFRKKDRTPKEPKSKS